MAVLTFRKRFFRQRLWLVPALRLFLRLIKRRPASLVPHGPTL